jgi:hypothetical protein|tara:strand:+ start:648 stop:761 length:114 start_codon:yes stop_codon:yes gene_type:complete
MRWEKERFAYGPFQVCISLHEDTKNQKDDHENFSKNK